jgi:GntR family transcriptional regulator, transcriptional repressor for pyruvate dehydrogenase complex
MAPVDRTRVLKTVSVPSAADVVVGQLTRAIELGRLLPGDRLPAERELAMQLGVSRVTLRGALRELAAAGLLERSGRGSGGGALVVAAEPTRAGDGGHLARREELAEIYEFRVACESAAAELAAERRTDADLARLEQAIDDLGGELTSAGFRVADNAFHLALADAARNGRLREAIEDARAAMFRPLDALDFELAVPRAVEDHQRILDAVAAGDPVAAKKAVVEHLGEAQRELLVAFAIADRSR